MYRCKKLILSSLFVLGTTAMVPHGFVHPVFAQQAIDISETEPAPSEDMLGLSDQTQNEIAPDISEPLFEEKVLSVDDLKSENNNLNLELDGAQSLNEFLQEQNSTLSTSLQNEQSFRSEMEMELQETTATLEEFRRELEILKQNNSMLHDNVETYSRAQSATKNELQRLRGEVKSERKRYTYGKDTQPVWDRETMRMKGAQNEAQLQEALLKSMVETHASVSDIPVEDVRLVKRAEQPQMDAKERAPNNDIETLLVQADVKTDGSVQMVASSETADLRVYQWKEADSGLYGSALQHKIMTGQNFDDFVQSYLEKTQARCQADFAITPTNSQDFEETRADSYEIACVGDGIDSSASILFFEHEGYFTILAHEASVDNMAKAMDLRDRIAQVLD